MALSAFVSVAPASATTWSSNGSASGTAFTATAPASKFTISGVSAGISCTTTTATGKLYGPTGALTTPVGNLTLGFTSCRSGGFTYIASCTTDGIALNAVSYAAPTLTGTFSGAAMPICRILLPWISGCVVTIEPTNGIGSVFANVTYNNTTGTLAVSRTGQQLTATWSACSTWFGSASGSSPVTLTDSSGADLVYSVTSAFVPNITI